MGLKSAFMKSVRARLDAWGYALVKREYAPFGQDVVIDIRRLSRQWGYPMRTCFDVGANVGQTAARLLKEFPEAAVYAFEPHPQTFSELRTNIGSSSACKPFNIALGMAEGEVDLFEYEESQVNSLVEDAPYAVHRQNRPKRRIPVRSTTIDAFCLEQKIGHIDLLKIDTEGFDFQVLKGTQGLLSRRKIGFVYMEFNSIHPQAGMTHAALAPIDEFLFPLGYRFVATYTDKVSVDGRFFLSCNALFAMPPESLDR
jgi:FkbM family methyltransferase